ncbi:unnamed protein product [Cladocopium goreaui]|uniref:Uncharacterized protein n=1 Tax=Cladocopium goreaui TaxID=2562237 RepID=A0A9P1DGV2_9DINO|nr:unnamed protein product [Cladocopium goreaui]
MDRYTPATLDEYKQRFGSKADYAELGRLGPDLDDEDLLMKRAIQEKVKEFSRELHRVNKHRAGKAQSWAQPWMQPQPQRLRQNDRVLVRTSGQMCRYLMLAQLKLEAYIV